ncbi:acyl-CoA N-acyltransferase [Gonapodya prolifera JEL478]|uniref:Acyl-CoA N-acyltransferase n=1 Tax=Gonapodya prolifera (strain JEL478) TaxID=1344416 RepID=A0A138ZYV3_GONPJ|nr:acyl-CoA N-acyltransferase [Gonapodya prolifera JEL478]|eukprot:KXS09687.1 acyl-CoA N-acyltransferase [Gonapodya prolifera JEL478]
MSSAYGVIARPSAAVDLSTILPVHASLRDKTPVLVDRVDKATVDAASLEQMRELLNHEIRDGKTYPQETELDPEAFAAYFLSYDAFAARDAAGGELLGCFYIKPNFPGRCSHICNAGFLTMPAHRNRGVGRALATAFLRLAPALGYRASMFNLVFESNEASVRLWRSFGFREIGRVPEAGRLKVGPGGSEVWVDAIQFYYDFIEGEQGGVDAAQGR